MNLPKRIVAFINAKEEKTKYENYKSFSINVRIIILLLHLNIIVVLNEIAYDLKIFLWDFWITHIRFIRRSIKNDRKT